MAPPPTPLLSVVVPMFDEDEVLGTFVERTRAVLDGLGEDYELLAVDDGSRDRTPVLLQAARRTWPQLRVVRLRANSGHQAALSAGLARARGDWVVTLDADLQDPPETIPAMLETARSEEVDVVYGVRTDRSTDSRFKRRTAQAFYRTMQALGAGNAPQDAADFRLMSRATVDAVNALPEQHRVLRLVVPDLGFPSATVGYRRAERAAGTSKYPLSTMLRLSLDAITGYSAAPLRLATWFGLGGFLVAILLLLYAFIAKASGYAIAGWTSTVVIVAAFAALQLLCVGIMGEYVGRIYSAMQGRPTYYVAHDSLDVSTARSAPAPRAEDGAPPQRT